MVFSVLVMGLSGAGKTTLADLLSEQFSSVERLNADVVRKETINWDFSATGRIAQCVEMQGRASQSTQEVVISDFIAPTVNIRKLFNADYTVWMNTVTSSQYSDTDALFNAPTNVNYTVTDYDPIHIINIAAEIKEILNVRPVLHPWRNARNILKGN